LAGKQGGAKMKRLIVLSAVILFVLSAVTGVVGCQEESTPTPSTTPTLTPMPTPDLAPAPPRTPTPAPETDMSTQNQAGQNQKPKVLSKEDSQKIAVDFLRSSPTFRFDGMDNTLKLVWSGGDERTSRWEFHYKFQSAAAEYGDRSGMILAQVITDHEARITVERGEVVHAVLDGKWDMIRQEMLK